MMDVAESGFGRKSVKVVIVMGEVLYGVTDFGFGLKSVKCGEGEITESRLGLKSVMISPQEDTPPNLSNTE
jgi:hypothetical protein